MCVCSFHSTATGVNYIAIDGEYMSTRATICAFLFMLNKFDDDM